MLGRSFLSQLLAKSTRDLSIQVSGLRNWTTTPDATCLNQAYSALEMSNMRSLARIHGHDAIEGISDILYREMIAGREAGTIEKWAYFSQPLREFMEQNTEAA